ncbi:glycoside hydrolase family 32 protein [Microbacterium saccharophilum]|uniref:Glycoside hydrolase family 32 protein n=1 Tax=Microbacterium saccharophilum TaxID=1213358 RepID=A0A5C8I826_9MICO|nr:glycoside hydrolase family 32 protein [Microbacterium saccharophilum]TXK14948.1 glycoside hydrolase family 32 protein [Microbacterium saccharophilum]GEP47344.1 levanbiose-producing levanase [Microbacterium saccharophilum]
MRAGRTKEGHPRRTLLWVIAAAIALIAAVVIIVTVQRSPTESAPTPSATATPSPPASDPYRPALHITPERHWMNDPQRPVFADGLWHAYYLYNADYPEGNGTAWYHVSSPDLVEWTDHGIAIEKYRNGLGDIQSGSVVVDERDTAGFGAGALVALVTQQDAGVQRQSLFFSTDGGFTFTPYDGNPVLDNPGVDDFRDPKVVWDGRQWVMALAEGDKVGFYVSPDLISWTYTSGFIRDDLGLLECPDLFSMAVESDPDRSTWVLGVSANGAAYDRTTGYAYWTGQWDGTQFVPAQDEPRWLDDGSDFYAAVTWPATDEEAAATTRYALGWVNNWGYARELPTEAWQGGAQSLVRGLTLVDDDGGLRLRAVPIAAVDDHLAVQSEERDLTLTSGTAVPLADAARTHRVRLDLERHRMAEAAITLTIGGNGGEVDVRIDGREGTVTVDRSRDAAAAALPDPYRDPRSTPIPWQDDTATVEVIVDGLTLELFVGDGASSLTSLVFVPEAGLSLTSDADSSLARVQLSRVG